MDREIDDEQIPVLLNWSSGKDAALAYLLLQGSGYEVCQLLTTINGEQDRIFMHGVREELLDMQAERMGVPLHKAKLPPAPDDSLYKNTMKEVLADMKARGIEHVAYGDIFLEDLKQYREAQLATVGMKGVFPLWKRDTRELVQQVEDTGIEAIIVCTNAKYLGREYLGRKVNRELLADLPANVDPCGENGEFHTFVYDAPYFSAPIALAKGEVVYREYKEGDWDNGFWFLDLTNRA